MAPAGRGAGRRHGGSGFPLGRRRRVRSEARGRRADLFALGRLRRRCRSIRPALLRDQPRGGTILRSPAAAAARDHLGGRRARRPRVVRSRRVGDRRLPRHLRERVPSGGDAGPSDPGRLLVAGHRSRPHRRPDLVLARTAGAECSGRHRLLLVGGGAAPRLPGAAQRRVRHGAGGRRQPAALAVGLRLPEQAQAALAHGALPPLRGGRRRLRPGGGVRDGAAQAALRRPARRRRRARRDPGFGDQPRWTHQRLHGAERPRAGGGDPPGAPSGSRRCSDDRRHGVPQHGHAARRPDRGAGARHRLRPRASGRAPARAGIHQDEHRPRRGSGRHRRRDEDRAVAAAPPDPPDVAPRSSQPAHPLGRPARACRHRGPLVGARQSPEAGGRELLRDERHERAPDPGGGARGGGALDVRGVELSLAPLGEELASARRARGVVRAVPLVAPPPRAALRHRVHRERATHAPRAPARLRWSNTRGPRAGALCVRGRRHAV
jgi:hypothetical protein